MCSLEKSVNEQCVADIAHERDHRCLLVRQGSHGLPGLCVWLWLQGLPTWNFYLPYQRYCSMPAVKGRGHYIIKDSICTSENNWTSWSINLVLLEILLGMRPAGTISLRANCYMGALPLWIYVSAYQEKYVKLSPSCCAGEEGASWFLLM